MINDSVREDLEAKVLTEEKSAKFEVKGRFPMPNQKSEPVKTINLQKSADAGTNTTEIFSSPTSPTLVEFHNKNAAVPEWRLQLQNTVRQRQERSTDAGKTDLLPAQKKKLVTSGATALKIEAVGKIAESEVVHSKNPTLASALQRIQNSRQKFLTEEEKEAASLLPAPPQAANKSFPFHIAKKTNAATVINSDAGAADFSQRPKIATSLKKAGEDFDTNKLPALPAPAKISTSFESQPAVAFETEAKITALKEKTEIVKEVKTNTKTIVEEILPVVEAEEFDSEEADDCAPLAMRFNAGLFDLIIGSFSSLLLLSPFMLLGGSWLTLSGLAAFVVTCAVVMFLYMTTSIGMYGKTYGMRLFSLEVIDIEGENYPTLHQAAVSSSLYLASLAFAGIGFLTMLFNEEKRAVHDLVSGTIVVREF